MRHFFMAALVALTPLATPGIAGAADAPPALYRVTGISSGSFLNVRAEPSTDSAVLGRLGASAEDIEVVARDPSGDWGRINLGEGSGWISLEFVVSQGEVWEAGKLPETLRCFGTEPFWSVAHRDGTLVHLTPDTAERPMTIESITGGGAQRVVVARDAAGAMTLGIVPEACSDGMSDRAFGLGARIAEGDSPALIGCCSLAPRS